MYREREAVWEPPEETPRRSLPPPAAPRRETPQPFGNAQRGDDLSKMPVKIVDKMKDNTELCKAFNKGSCSNRNCKFKHLCGGVILSSGRVCGGRHPASKCRNPKVNRVH